MRFYIIVIFVLFRSILMASPQTIVVSGDNFSEYIIPKCEYKLVSKQWEPDGVYSEKGWKTTSQKALNFGMTDQGCWIRIKISGKKTNGVVLTAESGLLDSFIIYQAKSNHFTLISKPIENWDIYRAYHIPINDVNEFYIFVKPRPGINAPFRLCSNFFYSQQYTIRLIFFGLLSGVFILVVTYSLVLYTVSKLHVMGIYGLYALFTYIAQSTTSSILLPIFEAKDPSLQISIITYSVAGVAVLSGLFLYSFLMEDDNRYNSPTKYILGALPVIGASIAFIHLLFERWAYLYMNFAMMIVALICISYPIWLLSKGNKRSIFIIVGWFPFLICAIIFMLSNVGVFEYYSFTPYLMPIGASLESMLFSLALGFRVRKLKEDQHQIEMKIIRQDAVNQELDNQVFKYKMDALRSQLNPHLMFNALSSIKSSIVRDEPERAQDLIQRISLLMRDSLEISRKESIPLSKELKFVRDYMEIEMVKGNVTFEYSVTIEDNLDVEDPFIPANMLQPLCENAVKHAFNSTKNEINTIELTISKHGDDLIQFIIKDNGSGFVESDEIKKRRSYGISIIRERLEMFISYGYQATVEINFKNEEFEDHGTVVRLVLPSM